MMRQISGFLYEKTNTPVFVFLCALFLCGAVAGGLTGLAAEQTDRAVYLVAALSAVQEQPMVCLRSALLWIVAALACGLVRPCMLPLSALIAGRGFLLALVIAVAVRQGSGVLRTFLCLGVPSVLSIAALLCVCMMVWYGAERTGARKFWRKQHVLLLLCCFGIATAGAILRVLLARFW